MKKRLRHRNWRYMLYFNGLERTSSCWPEKLLKVYYWLRKIHFAHHNVDWHSQETFEQLLESATEQARDILREQEHIILVGASAGGSLALGVYWQLWQDYPDAKIFLATVSSRLHVVNKHELAQSALHRRGKKASFSYIDSVKHCNMLIATRYSATLKQSMCTFRPLVDMTVQVSTMSVYGVEQHKVYMLGHVPGIVASLLWLPQVIEKNIPPPTLGWGSLFDAQDEVRFRNKENT